MSQNPVLFKENGESFNKFIKSGLFVFSKIMPKKLCEKIEYHYITKYNNTPCKKIGTREKPTESARLSMEAFDDWSNHL